MNTYCGELAKDSEEVLCIRERERERERERKKKLRKDKRHKHNTFLHQNIPHLHLNTTTTTATPHLLQVPSGPQRRPPAPTTESHAGSH